MGFITNYFADRANGKKEVAKLRYEDVKEGIKRSPEQQKQADKAAYSYGFYESRSNRKAANSMPKTKYVDKSKTKNTKIDKETNGIKVEASVFGKKSNKSTKPTSKKAKSKK